MSVISDAARFVALAPKLLALIDAIRLAAKDKQLSPEEIQRVGRAFVELVAAIVKAAPKDGK